MNRKKIFRFFGTFYIVLGIALILNGFSSITGFVIIEESISKTGSLFGIIFLIIGILINIGTLTLEKIVEKEEDKDHSRGDYFEKRVKELFDPKYNGQDAWVSRWELAGILDYIKNAKDRSNANRYSDIDFGHGSDKVSFHTYASEPSRGKSKEFFEKNKGKELPRGLPINIPHIHVYFREGETYYNRHLFVTDNPTDPKVKTLGIVGDGERGIRTYSKTYNPNHPISDARVKNEIQITYSKLTGELGLIYQNITKSEKGFRSSIDRKNKLDAKENIKIIRSEMDKYISKMEETKTIDDNHKLYSQEIDYIRKDVGDRLRKYRNEVRKL